MLLKLRNGSKCWALPGTERTVRGLSALDMLVVDEASRVDDSLITGVRPMLAVKAGTLILASTPWARLGTFYETWVAGGEDWERVMVPATLIPRLSRSFYQGNSVRSATESIQPRVSAAPLRRWKAACSMPSSWRR